ncbi:MAG: hypothetical protein ILNGONEN_02158 [Syntrophorhabdaceae bacterium]|nr:hypothetical protein [Syntrophorhabdaceae bacterium]
MLRHNREEDNSLEWQMRKKSIQRRKVFALLFITLLILVLFTWLVTLQKIYVLQYSVEFKIHPQFSLPNIITKIYSSLDLFLIIVTSFVVGFLLSIFVFRKENLENLVSSQNLMISQTLWHILKENIWEFILLFAVILLVLFNLATWIEDINRTSPSSLAPTLISLFLALFSIMIAIIEIYYSFLSEKKSDDTLKNSTALLNERGDFLEHFTGFINRINRKIEGPGGVLDDVNVEQRNEKHYYFIKCMFLTPYLGHAGLTSSNKEIFDSYQKFQTNIGMLINNPYCHVQLLTLTPEKIISWYAQILWVEYAKIEMAKIRKPLSEFTTQERQKINEEVRKTLLTQKGLGSLQMDDNYGAALSFTDLSNRYQSTYGGYKDNQQKLKKLEICHTDYIPFQLFLVMKPKITNLEEFPSDTAFEKNEFGEIIEEGKFVVLTFVGDKTYYALIDDMLVGTHSPSRNGGIDDLLKNLHSAFYSEDPRICNILNNHFNHYWTTTDPVEHFPKVSLDDWQKIDVSKCLPNSNEGIQNA